MKITKEQLRQIIKEEVDNVKINSNHTKRYYKNLILYYENGRLARIEKPLDKIKVEINSDGAKYWAKNGKIHRDGDLPAAEYADGSKSWYKNGRLIRKEKGK